MQQFVNDILSYLQNFISSCPFFISVMLGMLIIVLESIIPALPLGVFVALNMILLGNITGFITSWVATTLGCFLSFNLVRKYFHKQFEKKSKDNDKIRLLLKRINKFSFSSFVLITALPFTPAFAINIAAGLSKMDEKKFIMGIFIAKLSIVYFWGFIGTTFLQSVTDIKVLIKLGIMLLLAYVLSKIVMKKFKLD